MKKETIIIAFLILLSSSSISQQWIYFPNGINNNKVNIGAISVSGNSITVEALITIRQPPSVTFNDIVSKHYDSNDANYLLRPTGFGISTTSGFAFLNNPIQLCLDSTYHVAGTYDGDSIKYFVNGIQVAAQHWTGNLTQNSHNTCIGNMDLTNSYYEQFIGYIDEVRIWNISRNNPDIAANMNNLSNPTSQTGLLGYYQFNGNYNNLQGNTSYNGIGVGGLLQNISNPLFNGSVSFNFCSLQEIFENKLNSKIRIYPNPSDGNISIDFENYIIDNSTLIVTNLVGQTLKTIKISNKTTEISIHEPDGIYFFTIESNAGNYSTKLIIKNDK